MNDSDSETRIKISTEARRYLTEKVRRWSGWPDARLTFGETRFSPVSEVSHETHEIRVRPEAVILNPNRVLLTVNPFRLRQEAVLTGALIHEIAHARYSRWQPGRYGNPAVMRHTDGTEVHQATLALCAIAEEARIEGAAATYAREIGIERLEWTMRAMAAYLLPPTVLSTDPNRTIMDLICSWLMRVGREIAVNTAMGNPAQQRQWVGDFTSFVHVAIGDHMEALGRWRAIAVEILDTLRKMVRRLIVTEANAREQVDDARRVLELLFPETPLDQQPWASAPGCGCSEAPPQESEGEEPGGSETGSEGGSEGDTDSGEEAGEGESDEKAAAMAEALAALEARAAETNEGANAARSEDPETAGPMEQSEILQKMGAGIGTGSSVSGWADPTNEDRAIKREAESFLRSMIEPTESTAVSLTDQPSSAVDGAALSAWKASGMVREPHFFRRTRRSVEPSPPAQIAILVDISSSMGVLQGPSALLSWALASAALDLRNFAGRGTQVESCLIHWGDDAHVVQKNGAVLPGIRKVQCDDGTHAMPAALDLVAEQMPGFFEPQATPVSRLLVQFTDWKLHNFCVDDSSARVSKALANGVNMLSVMPKNVGLHHTSLPSILKAATIQRGKALTLFYDHDTSEVWRTAAALLSLGAKTPAIDVPIGD